MNADDDGRIAAIDADKCGPYMAANHGCGVCIAVCPFSLAGYEKIQAGFLKAQAGRQQ
jgi:ferredoxin